MKNNTSGASNSAVASISPAAVLEARAIADTANSLASAPGACEGHSTWSARMNVRLAALSVLIPTTSGGACHLLAGEFVARLRALRDAVADLRGCRLAHLAEVV